MILSTCLHIHKVRKLAKSMSGKEPASTVFRVLVVVENEMKLN